MCCYKSWMSVCLLACLLALIGVEKRTFATALPSSEFNLKINYKNYDLTRIKRQEDASAVEDILSEDGPLEEANEEEIIEESSGDYELEASETLESSGGDETLLEASGQEGSGVIWPQVKMATQKGHRLLF